MFTEIYKLEGFTAVILRLPEIPFSPETDLPETVAECFDYGSA